MVRDVLGKDARETAWRFEPFRFRYVEVSRNWWRSGFEIHES